MGISNNIHTYNDVKHVLMVAKNAGGGRYKLESHGKAVHWRQRAYKFRSIVQRDAGRQAGVKGFQPPTWVDDLTFKVEKGSTEVIITIREPEGQLLSLSGVELDIESAETPPLYEPSDEEVEEIKQRAASPLSDFDLAALSLIEEEDEETPPTESD